MVEPTFIDHFRECSQYAPTISGLNSPTHYLSPRVRARLLPKQTTVSPLTTTSETYFSHTPNIKPMPAHPPKSKNKAPPPSTSSNAKATAATTTTEVPIQPPTPNPRPTLKLQGQVILLMQRPQPSLTQPKPTLQDLQKDPVLEVLHFVVLYLCGELNGLSECRVENEGLCACWMWTSRV
ncbi:hypothetical protein L873DRAFT_1818451 [Choiromyces venosus 120613-1]|uniref:Uncharacterized protein n=1 Tax=Choiromyces venosus 120613-1 TaxID=1336337 RepID=A0A3N4JDV3_9PEZI|nr:hypothetical protein L873DRAFT_1818451 [Choiromyces venosus 120613-1]